MLVCKNAIVTFWNALFNKNNNKSFFIHAAPLHFMENKAHFVLLICPRKVQYTYICIHNYVGYIATTI